MLARIPEEGQIESKGKEESVFQMSRFFAHAYCEIATSEEISDVYVCRREITIILTESYV